MNTQTFTAIAIAALLAAAPLRAEVVHFTASLDGASETPPNPSAGKGTADVTLDTESRVISWTVSYTGLSGPATMGHFHGPAAVGIAAGVQIPMSGDLTSPIKGSTDINDGQIGDLRAGLWYINIHTARYPKGEIRGQLTQSK